MKIDDALKKTAGLTVGTAQTRANKGAEKAAEKTATSGATSDSVHLSTQLQSLEGQVSNSSVFDSNKVDAIKAAIAGGKFQVNAEKVANGLIDSVSDLLKSRKA